MSFRYEHVTGFFHSDVLAPVMEAEQALEQSFGLLDMAPDRWESLKAKIAQLNKEGEKDGTSYKLLWFGRHGQGFHNVAERKYTAEGTWENHWSHLTTDGTLTWGPDAALTPLGVSQASALRTAWRTCQTCVISWGGVWSEVLGNGAEGQGVEVEVVEDLRERAWFHTCDSRRPKSVAQAQFPHLNWPASMPENDSLWRPDVHESEENTWARITRVLDLVWAGEDAYVSLTGHADIMRACFKVTGHPNTPIVPGQLIPQVVRRVKV